MAAFFAFFDSLRLRRDDSCDVAICAIHLASFRNVAAGQFEVIETRGQDNIPARNQLGRFIVNRRKYRSLDQHVCEASPDTAETLVKFTVPGSDRIKAFNELLLMGISPVEIYPDHEGIAMYVRLRQALDGYQL